MKRSCNRKDLRNMDEKYFSFETSRLQDPISDEEEGNDSDYDEGFCDEDDWFSQNETSSSS